jgi:hypothetical protein
MARVWPDGGHFQRCGGGIWSTLPKSMRRFSTSIGFPNTYLVLQRPLGERAHEIGPDADRTPFPIESKHLRQIQSSRRAVRDYLSLKYSSVCGTAPALQRVCQFSSRNGPHASVSSPQEGAAPRAGTDSGAEVPRLRCHTCDSTHSRRPVVRHQGACAPPPRTCPQSPREAR